jgi:hypothetical protein
LLVKPKPVDTQSTHLGNIDVSNHLIIHVYKGAALGLTAKDTEGGYEVYVLSGNSNRGVGNDGRLGRHGEMIRGGDVEAAEVFCRRLRENPS